MAGGQNGLVMAFMALVLQNFLSGSYLSHVSQIIWVLTGIQDILSSFTFIVCVWSIPVSSCTAFAINDTGHYEFAGITYARKFSVIFVQLIRLAVAIALLVGGVQFLAYTISISDLILNAMVGFSPT